jgi:hypothetical protein
MVEQINHMMSDAASSTDALELAWPNKQEFAAAYSQHQLMPPSPLPPSQETLNSLPTQQPLFNQPQLSTQNLLLVNGHVYHPPQNRTQESFPDQEQPLVPQNYPTQQQLRYSAAPGEPSSIPLPLMSHLAPNNNTGPRLSKGKQPAYGPQRQLYG